MTGVEDEGAGSGTIGYWFWGSLLAFGAFLVVVPGRDPRALFWLVAGLVLAVVSAAGLAVVLLGRRQQRVQARHRTGIGQ